MVSGGERGGSHVRPAGDDDATSDARRLLAKRSVTVIIVIIAKGTASLAVGVRPWGCCGAAGGGGGCRFGGAVPDEVLGDGEEAGDFVGVRSVHLFPPLHRFCVVVAIWESRLVVFLPLGVATISSIGIAVACFCSAAPLVLLAHADQRQVDSGPRGVLIRGADLVVTRREHIAPHEARVLQCRDALDELSVA